MMRSKEPPIYLNIRNTSAQQQAISLFNYINPAVVGSSSGGTTWDMTSDLATAALYSSNILALLVAPLSTGTYQLLTYNKGSTFTTIAQVIAALNTLNVGVFTNPSGNLVKAEYTTTYVYSSLSLTNLYTAASSTAAIFNYFGALVYDANYTVGGVGNFTRINTSVPFWINSVPNLVDGPMNRESIWNNAVPIPNGQQVGVYTQFVTPTAQTVYIGLSGDDDAIVYVNNTKILQFDRVAMGANIDVVLGPGYNNGQQTFSFWHIFPFQTVAGNNIVQVQNFNSLFSGGLGCEIYNNTASQILASTGYSDLSTLFRSNSWIGLNLF